MRLKGRIRGQVIEFPENLDFPDGTMVTVEVTPVGLSDRERLEKLQQLFGCWAGQSDLMENFEQIDRERHQDLGREVNLFT
jgi:hypothetical protein